MGAIIPSYPFDEQVSSKDLSADVASVLKDYYRAVTSYNDAVGLTAEMDMYRRGTVPEQAGTVNSGFGRFFGSIVGRGGSKRDASRGAEFWRSDAISTDSSLPVDSSANSTHVGMRVDAMPEVAFGDLLKCGYSSRLLDVLPSLKVVKVGRKYWLYEGLHGFPFARCLARMDSWGSVVPGTLASLLASRDWGEGFQDGDVAPDESDVLMCEHFETYGIGVDYARRYGCCYLAIVHPVHRASILMELGEWPTAERVLHIGASVVDWTAEFGILVHADDRWHVTLDQDKGFEMLAGLARASEWPGGSFGAHLGDNYGRGFVSALALGSRLGGRMDLEYHDVLRLLSGQSDNLPAERVNMLSRSAALLTAEEKRQYKMLEALGDSVLTMVVALKCVRESRTPEEYQTARSAITSNPSLSARFVACGLHRYVAFVAGVSPGQGKAGAYVMEAILGSLFEAYGLDAVEHACEKLGLFSLYQWEPRFGQPSSFKQIDWLK